MRILVIEPEKTFSEAISTLLKKEGYSVETLNDCKLAYDYIALGIYDLMILSVMPSGDSYELAKFLRKNHYTLPILALSGQPATKECIEILNAGADYYLAKGKEPKELLTCISALLRRNGSQLNELSLGNTTLELSSGTLSCNGLSVRLTAKEYDMMRLLLQNPSHNLSKEMLLSYVWGYESNATENHVEVYIGFLRKKLATIHSNVSICTIRKLGYHLELIQ